MSSPQNKNPEGLSRPAPQMTVCPAPQVPTYEVKTLFGTSKEILIRHASEVYRLRITRQNKLILTK